MGKIRRSSLPQRAQRWIATDSSSLRMPHADDDYRRIVIDDLHDGVVFYDDGRVEIDDNGGVVLYDGNGISNGDDLRDYFWFVIGTSRCKNQTG